PVLAVWQYGLGRVAAWTSDALGLWTANWLSWKDAARSWANLVTWTLPTPESQLLVSGQISNGNGHITVNLPAATLSASQSIGQQQAQVNIITPGLTQETVILQPTAPGRFEGDFPTTQVGVYLLRVTWQARGSNGANSSQLSTTTGLVVPYSPEYSTSGTDLNFLSQLAHAGGGSVLAADNYAAAFTPNLPPVYAALSITFWLFAIAALLLPIDIALRRLSSVEFLVAGYQWLTSIGKSRKAAQSEDNLVLSNIRAHREQRKTRVTSVKSPDSPIQKTPVATLDRQEASLKKEQEQSTTSKLLEEKRKREQAKTRRE
ncbi:MAG: hypothetical protein ACRDIV_16685, partial [Ktedonobacteraceae bacterium]